MKIIYFDIISGVSGNMILGALLDAGLPADYLKEELSKLKLEFYDIEIEKKPKNHITGTLFKVNVNLKKQPHRKFSEIETLLNESDLSLTVKEKSLLIFKKLAQVEAKVHGIPVNLVHFHEVGAIDSIIDIAGSVIGLEYFKPDRIYSSKIVNGHGGLISSLHGKLPNPAPATLEILKGVPCENIDIKEELTTPTGASILAMLVYEFSTPPDMNISSIGYGCGEKDITELPNFLRIIIGDKELDNVDMDFVSVIETNIDNMNPEYYDWVIEEILKCGAYDVFLTPIIMKKSRPAVCLTAICPVLVEKKIVEFVLKNTSTFGVRISNLRREKLKRREDMVNTKYGSLRVKIGYLNNKVIKVSPEYEDVKKIASLCNISPQEIASEVIKMSDKIKE